MDQRSVSAGYHLYLSRKFLIADVRQHRQHSSAGHGRNHVHSAKNDCDRSKAKDDGVLYANIPDIAVQQLSLGIKFILCAF